MKAEEKIYRAFFELKQPKLYYNQIKDQTELSHSSLQNALEKLKKPGILAEEKTKSNTFYRIKDKKIVSLKFSEIAINKFNRLNHNIKTPLNNFLKNLPESVFTIILFGSASIGEERKGRICIISIPNRSKYSKFSVICLKPLPSDFTKESAYIT